MAELYREHILDHYQNPRNYGTLERPDRTFEDSNPLCGDRIRIDLKLENDRITDIRFTGRGCAISQAAASILTEMVKGKTLEEVKQLGAQDLLEELGVPISPARRKCALLSLKVLKAAAYGLDEWPT